MSADAWGAVRHIFRLVLDAEPGERPEILERECGTDEALRHEVEALLEAHRAADGFLEPIFGDPPQTDDAPLIGRSLGPYHILDRLGHGGMGTVYLAERDDSEFRKQVALKVLRPGLAEAGVVARFRTERQILASLEHPNIARLLDGGTTADGLPYLVMEAVEGEPIDRYCDRLRLDSKARIELFLEVCSAVAAAHRNLVVHRDIKPSNILVDTRGRPKLLDFGIAKLLENGGPSAPTQSGLHPMTPEFASPEQWTGTAITTATDIYSLGVLLYALLSGYSPHRFPTRSPVDIARMVLEDDPLPPSLRLERGSVENEKPGPEEIAQRRGSSPGRLRRRLRGDLDNIVLKALRKEPERRYGSVEQLADDLRRHLAGLPVRARPDTWVYRGGKFLRRHRLAVAAVASLVMASLVFGGVMGWQRSELRRERDRAETERHRSQVALGFLTDLFEVADPFKTPDEPLTVEALLAEGARRLEGDFADDPEIHTSLELTLGILYRQLGELERAEPLLEGAYAHRDRLAPGDPRRVESALELARLLRARGDYDRAGPILDDATVLERRERGETTPLTAEILAEQAAIRGTRSGYDAAENLYRRALDIARQVHGEPHPAVAEHLLGLALAREAQGDLDGAEALYRESLDQRLTLFGPHHPKVAESCNRLASIHWKRGELDKALELLNKALAISRASFGDHHPHTAESLKALGVVLAAAGRSQEAEASLRQALDIYRQALGPRHIQVGRVLQRLGEIHLDRGELDRAEELLRQALVICRETVGEDHPRTRQIEASLGRLEQQPGADVNPPPTSPPPAPAPTPPGGAG